MLLLLEEVWERTVSKSWLVIKLKVAWNCNSIFDVVAGAAGTTIRNKYGEPQVGEIIALDPAGPFFTMQIDRDKRVHRGDARFVAIYHSNRGTLGDSDHDTGDINVYINGGDNQPGCEEADKANSGKELAIN